MKKYGRDFRTIFLIVGISIGFFVWILEASMFYDFFPTLFVGVISGILIGLLVSLCGWVFVSYTRYIWWKNIIQVIVVFLFSSVISYIVVLLCWFYPYGNWEKLQAAPEHINYLLPSSYTSIFEYELFTQADSGTAYKYVCVESEECTWEQTEYQPPEEKDKFHRSKGIYLSPIPPGIPVDSLEVLDIYADASIYKKYVLLSNGNIYYWSRYENAHGLIALMIFLGPPYAIIIGLIASITVLSVRRRNKLESSLTLAVNSDAQEELTDEKTTTKK